MAKSDFHFLLRHKDVFGSWLKQRLFFLVSVVNERAGKAAVHSLERAAFSGDGPQFR